MLPKEILFDEMFLIWEYHALGVIVDVIQMSLEEFFATKNHVFSAHTLSYSYFILKIKNTFPIFGYMMHFC